VLRLTVRLAGSPTVRLVAPRTARPVLLPTARLVLRLTARLAVSLTVRLVLRLTARLAVSLTVRPVLRPTARLAVSQTARLVAPRTARPGLLPTARPVLRLTGRLAVSPTVRLVTPQTVRPGSAGRMARLRDRRTVRKARRAVVAASVPRGRIADAEMTGRRSASARDDPRPARTTGTVLEVRLRRTSRVRLVRRFPIRSAPTSSTRRHGPS
jgi:hypothetical protein